MKAKPHGINFTDADWQTLKAIADEQGITTSVLVNTMCREFVVHQYDGDWQGLKPFGWNRYSEDKTNSTEPPETGG